MVPLLGGASLVIISQIDRSIVVGNHDIKNIFVMFNQERTKDYHSTWIHFLRACERIYTTLYMYHLPVLVLEVAASSSSRPVFEEDVNGVAS